MNNRYPVKIVDKNGKSNTVYRSESPEKSSNPVVERINKLIKMRQNAYEQNDIEKHINNDLRERFPRSTFFIDSQSHPESLNDDYLTIQRDLNPYGELSDSDLEQRERDYVLHISDYLMSYSEARARGDSAVIQSALNIIEIGDHPTNITELNEAVKNPNPEYDERAQSTIRGAAVAFVHQAELDGQKI